VALAATRTQAATDLAAQKQITRKHAARIFVRVITTKLSDITVDRSLGSWPGVN